jgi:hypothetical protein
MVGDMHACIHCMDNYDCILFAFFLFWLFKTFLSAKRSYLVIFMMLLRETVFSVISDLLLRRWKTPSLDILPYKFTTDKIKSRL